MKLESRLWVLWDVASLLTVLRCVYEDSYMYGLRSSAVEVHAWSFHGSRHCFAVWTLWTVRHTSIHSCKLSTVHVKICFSAHP